MRITNSKAIHLTESEVRNAITAWLNKNLPYDNLAYKLFISNKSILDFDGKGNLSIVIDGEIEEYNSENR